MLRSKTLRLVGAVAALSLFATACSGDGGEGTGDPGDDATATDGETATDDGGTASDEYDWSDPKLRQALSMAIDRQEIVDVIFSGTQAVADDWWPPTLAGHRGDACENLEFNPERAAELFEETGGDKGPITITFNEGHMDWIEAVANQWRTNLGIQEVEFNELLFGDMLNRLENGEVDGPYRLGWLFDYPSPGNFLGPLHGSTGGSNYTGYSNEEFDAAYQAGDSKTVEEGIPDYQEAGDILCEDMPVAPVYFSVLNAVHSENVSGVEFDAFQYVQLSQLEDGDGDGVVSQYVCEPQNSLFGQMTSETCGAAVVNALFTGLYSLDKESGELVFDGVAESIESDDEQNWTITLNDGWTFHDGTPVTAQSFIDAWNWGAYGPNAAQNSYFFGVPGFEGYEEVSQCGTREATAEDVENELASEEGEEITDCEASPPPAEEMSGLTAADDLTIEVTLDEPFPQFPLVLLYNAFNPLPPDFFEAAEAGDIQSWGEAPNGNGPFQIDGTWEHNVGINTVAYEDYAGEAPSIDAYEFRIFENPDPAYLEVQNNTLDIIDTVPPAELANVEEDFGERYIREPTSVMAFIGFPIDPARVAQQHGD